MMRRAAFLAAAALTLACGGGDAPADEAPVELAPVEMPTEEQLSTVLASNYALIGFQWVLGDKLALQTWFADSTELWVAGMGSYWSPAQIANEWGGRGKELGVTDFTRTSQGFTVTDRLIADSGTYVITGERPNTRGMPDLKGRYWTTWRVTRDGQFLIVQDLHLGDGRPLRERDERPTRPTN
jgi:hypothetical protein